MHSALTLLYLLTQAILLADISRNHAVTCTQAAFAGLPCTLIMVLLFMFCSSCKQFLVAFGRHDPALVAFMQSNPRQKAPPFLASLPPAARLMPRLTMRCGFISDLVSTRRPLCVSKNLSKGSTTSCHAPFLHAQHLAWITDGTRSARTARSGGTNRSRERRNCEVHM